MKITSRASSGWIYLAIRNLWSLETGEVIAAEALLENVEGCEVYFPLRDVGVDLLVVRGSSHVGIQVKKSRYYMDIDRTQQKVTMYSPKRSRPRMVGFTFCCLG